jgi:hypothetical protein
MIAGLALLVVPVRASFGADPLLRLEPAGTGLPGPTIDVSCGTPLASVRRTGGGLSLYGLAKDAACHRAASRRVATAAAVAAVLGLVGLLGLTRARTRTAGAVAV